MALENEVKKLGRVEYIEPNNLFNNSPGNKIQNGIPQPYEDYSFSVNLRIINGDRFGCGLTDDGGDLAKNMVEYSSDNGTLSFMDGTSAGGQGYLTTNFTDISMNDPSTNTKECLGIESISVKYDSWYYPTVDIRFVDVRGASLMQPAEYEYYNNGGPSVGKNSATSNSKFFKAFFSFPYPLFKLSIKGFYGKEITYDLSVLKCNVEFNSSTGNFEVNASFIGYMYGMYADLPFPFVYIAPYIDLYGKNAWDEKINSKDFCYLTTDDKNPIGRGMYTFPELRREVRDAGEKSDKEVVNTPDGQKRLELQKMVDKLEKDALFNYPFKSRNFTWWSWSKTNTDEDKDGYFFIALPNSKETNRKLFEDFVKFSTYLAEYNEIAGTTTYYKNKTVGTKPVFDGIYEDAKAILENRKKSPEETASTVTSKYTDDEIKSVIENRIVSLVFHKDERDKENPVLVYDASSSSFGSNDASEYTELIDELKERFENDEVSSPMHKRQAEKEWTIRAVKIDNIAYKGSIVNTLNGLKKELNELCVNLAKLREQNIEKTIGFKPSMRNLYNMVFAHIDTFMTTYYNTLDRIRKSIQSSTDGSRKYTTLCGDSIKVDVNDNALKSDSPNGGKLPPFTMFYREETEKDSEDRKYTMVWPGSLNGGENLDEVKLVEAIINATSLNRRRNEDVSEKDNVALREGDLAPINYYDLVRDGGNPYLDVLNEKTMSEAGIANEVLKIFTLRCYYTMLNGSFVGVKEGETKDESTTSVSNFTEKAKLIASLEVGNVVRAFQMLNMAPNQNFLRKLGDLPENGNTAVSEYLKGDKPIFSSVGGNGNLTYRWINKGGNMCVPVGMFKTDKINNLLNEAKSNLGDDYDKFLKFNQNGTIVNGDYACRVFSGGKKVETVLGKYSSGDFTDAARLFPNYKTISGVISGLTFDDNTFGTKSLTLSELHDKIGSENFIPQKPILPSYRKSEAGITSIFMDPLYYAQTSVEARAYLFLMGVPYGKDKKFILPDYYVNSDYPTLMLLREGAIYWRNTVLMFLYDEGAPTADFSNDPITYKYRVNDVIVDVLDDIEANDPAFGVKETTEYYKNITKNASEGRKDVLMRYFLKWANGVETDIPYRVVADAKFKVTLPDPPLSFQELEQNLALWEVNGTVKQILSPQSCSLAVTSGAQFASAFANAGILRSIYNVGADDKLGNVNGKIRKDVTIVYNSGEVEPEDTINFKRKLLKLFVGFDSVIDFSCLDDFNNPTLSVPRGAMDTAVSEFIKGLKDTYRISIEKIKKAKKASSTGEPDDSYKSPEFFNSDDLKLACYMALKNIYDRWLCNRRRENWYFSCNPERQKTNGIKSDFLRFFYIDEFYHNIGMQICPNLTKFSETMCDLGGFTEKSNEDNLVSTSIIKILSTTAQYGGCALLTLPTMLGLADTYTQENNSIADVFKAYTYNDAVRSDSVETSFIVLYSNQKSSILDVPDDKGKMGYKTDGFDIANTWGEIVPQAMFSDGGEDGFVVPCFGVTFAKQNQSFFKDVRLSMEDHQVTEFSIRNEVAISYANNRGPRETTIIGQDLYSVYSNYSYSCTVSMMGDAQITPLMYFQLNNIPMWKGAYMITSVRHSITSRGMDTEFTGVRQARPSVPFKNDKMEVPLDESHKLTPQSKGEGNTTGDTSEDLNISQRPLDLIDVDKVRSIVIQLSRTATIEEPSDNNSKWLIGLVSARVYYEDGTDKQYENIGITREKLIGENGRIEDFSSDSHKDLFTIPSGKYSAVLVENAFTNKEYRNPNDAFYSFTDGKHITIKDMRLGFKVCEVITGETGYLSFNQNELEKISFGGTVPIMLYGYNSTDKKMTANKKEIRAVYKELFNLVRRMNEAKKPLTLLITEAEGIKDNKIKEG